MEEIHVNQREIWLCPFPFSDLSGEKVRPVLLLSHSNYNATTDDVIVCALTSNILRNPYTIIIEQSDCERGVLYNPSTIRVDTLFKLKKTLLRKPICTLNQRTFEEVYKILMSIFSIK